MFQEDFKYYKSRTNKPSLSNVIDFTKSSSISTNTNIRKVRILSDDNNSIIKNSCFGLRPCEEWNAYEITTHPGFIFIKNPFTSRGQRYWTVRSLKDYSKRPNKNNIDNQNLLEESEDWWTTCIDKTVEAKRRKTLRKKMRWVTLGYHHNWDTKEYDYGDKNEFPTDLKQLCSYIAKCMSFRNYSAEAAIMNFYSEGDTLAGHTDHSEPYKEAPLLSLSFGQSAIFLLGGQTKETKPMAVLVNSGDISILSGYARLCYHAVPLILKTNEEPWSNNEKNSENDNDIVKCNDEDFAENKVNTKIIHEVKNEDYWLPYKEYLEEYRINLNVRQVLFSPKS